MNKDKEILVKSIINVFETGTAKTVYDKIYIYNDGLNGRKQITLGRGFTCDGGNLKKVVESYISRSGIYSNSFKPYLSSFGKGTLVSNNVFKNLLIRASREDSKMRAAQDSVFDAMYFIPAMNWFKNNGFASDLSFLVIFDSYIHSGSILTLLRNRFAERPPAAGGDEKKWVEEYLKARRSWLANHSNRILRNTIYRCDFMLGEIKKNNWQLKCPLRAHGVNVC